LTKEFSKFDVSYFSSRLRGKGVTGTVEHKLFTGFDYNACTLPEPSHFRAKRILSVRRAAAVEEYMTGFIGGAVS
jgi:hypothetical protein